MQRMSTSCLQYRTSDIDPAIADQSHQTQIRRQQPWQVLWRHDDIEVCGMAIADKPHTVLDVAMVHDVLGACNNVAQLGGSATLRTQVACSLMLPSAR